MGNCVHRNKTRTTHNIRRISIGEEMIYRSIQIVSAHQMQRSHDIPASMEINRVLALSNDNSDEVSDNNIATKEFDISFEYDTADTDNLRVYVGSTFCQICASEYNETDHTRVILPCGHVFCLHCVQTICKNNWRVLVMCPLDRSRHYVKNGRKVQEHARLLWRYCHELI